MFNGKHLTQLLFIHPNTRCISVYQQFFNFLQHTWINDGSIIHFIFRILSRYIATSPHSSLSIPSDFATPANIPSRVARLARVYRLYDLNAIRPLRNAHILFATFRFPFPLRVCQMRKHFLVSSVNHWFTLLEVNLTRLLSINGQLFIEIFSKIESFVFFSKL